MSLLGTTIGGRYRLDSILGEGGMGTVYAAEHLLMRKRVALKVLHPEMSRVPEVVARFEREAMAAGHLDHPNVAAATDFGQLDDGSFFLVLELIEGASLRDIIALGHMAVKRAIHIARQITGALARAHSLGVVHRDLKPDNVMLITRGHDPDFVKVLDFGIAKVPMLDMENPSPPSSAAGIPASGAPKVLTKMGMIYGTPEYMAPEQALGQAVDGRSDLYAVGILLYEMLTGKRPFDHDNMATLLGLQVTAPVPMMSEKAPDVRVPPSVETVVRRLLAKDPAERFASAEELETALSEVSFAVAPTEYPPPDSVGRVNTDVPIVRVASSPAFGSVNAPVAPRSRTPWLVAAGSALVAVVAAVALATRGSQAPTNTAATTASEAPSSVASTVLPTSAVPAQAVPVPTTSADASGPLAAALAEADADLLNSKAMAAINLLAPLESTNPENAAIHRILEKGYATTHDRAAALREADVWLTLDPTATSDLKLQADIGEIATHPTEANAAIALLASRMGAPGVDILYDLVYASKQAPSVSSRARATLEDPAVRAHAGPAAALLLDLRAATKCESKRALLARAKTDGDPRALPVLISWTARHGGGACMRGDSELTDAIEAVRGRARML